METLIFLIILFATGFFAGYSYAYTKAIDQLKALVKRIEKR